MNLPTEQQCLDYFEQFAVPENIKAHCLTVQQVAVFLAEKLQKQGEEIDVQLVRTAALLHDLFKMVSIKSIEPTPYHLHNFSEREIAMWKKLRQEHEGKHESDVAYEFFKEDFPELARVLLQEGNPYLRERSMADALLLYADYRVLKTDIVTLNERFAYLEETYHQKNPEFWKEFKEYLLREEANLFRNLPFKPEELKANVEAVKR